MVESSIRGGKNKFLWSPTFSTVVGTANQKFVYKLCLRLACWSICRYLWAQAAWNTAKLNILVYRVMVGKPEGKRPLARPRRRWVDNIRMDLHEVGCG